MLGTKPAHPTEGELFNYCDTRPPERNNPLSAHLAACPECAARLDAILFGRALDALAARPDRRLNHPGLLRAALLSATKHPPRPALRQRLVDWAGKPGAFAGGVVQWHPAPGRAKGPGCVELVATFTESSPWRIETGVAGKSSSAAASAPGEPPLARVSPTGPDELAVQVRHWPADAAPPLVLLAREVRARPPVVKQARRHPRLPVASACFGDLVPGRYLLALEPVPPPFDLH